MVDGGHQCHTAGSATIDGSVTNHGTPPRVPPWPLEPHRPPRSRATSKLRLESGAMRPQQDTTSSPSAAAPGSADFVSYLLAPFLSVMTNAPVHGAHLQRPGGRNAGQRRQRRHHHHHRWLRPFYRALRRREHTPLTDLVIVDTDGDGCRIGGRPVRPEQNQFCRRHVDFDGDDASNLSDSLRHQPTNAASVFQITGPSR